MPTVFHEIFRERICVIRFNKNLASFRQEIRPKVRNFQIVISWAPLSPPKPTYEKRHGVEDTQFGAEGRRLLVGGGVGLGHLQNTVFILFS